MNPKPLQATGISSVVAGPVVVSDDSTEDPVTTSTAQRHDTEESSNSNPCGCVVLALVLSTCLLGVLFALFMWCCVVGNRHAEDTASYSDEGEL